LACRIHDTLGNQKEALDLSGPGLIALFLHGVELTQQVGIA
jgi:hypothetical protein